MSEQPGLKESYPKMYMYKRIVEAKLYIDQHYSEKIDLDNIATQASFSKYHFLRLFKQAYGKSPYQYLTQVRIAKAQEYLREGKSVMETCEALSFDSIPSFTALFKKQTGITPKAFFDREELQRIEAQKSPFSYVPNCYAETYNWRK